MTRLGSPWDSGQVIAHRGSRVHWPENTMIAFEGGLEAGANHLETDLHLTADGHIVCFHDDHLDRTTNGSGPIREVTLSELRRLDPGHNHMVDGGFPFRGRGLRVPTLGEVLATFPDVGVVVDLKQPGLEEALVAVLEKMDAWLRVIVGSFSDRRLERVREISGGRAQRSAGPGSARRWWAASRWGRSGPDDFVALQVPPSMFGLGVVDRRLVRAAHRAGLAVHVWTINNLVEMERLWDLGIDAIITDRPEVAAGMQLSA
ncbi:MAG: glycerophosphodiester phosphodiesterase [Acidimicrobiia bacterium]